MLRRKESMLRRKESAAGKDAAAGAGGARKGSRRNRLLLWHYWHRLLGAAVGWFAWDFYYCELFNISASFTNYVSASS